MPLVWHRSEFCSRAFADIARLIYYTPKATIVRLFSIGAINAYLTSWTLQLVGGNNKPQTFLPAWIFIAFVLTISYHMTLRKINVSRGEFSPAISVLCFVSFCSMCTLLYEIHLCPPVCKRQPV
ncbi:hypothetical protein P167DRAFT_304561 [Morchella conica CCBAS932]|uniref:Uncharacterized protein n=1 Tax=Morchella conica CCBAS932 TaxID=1392247 RepID=A0A3N4KM74_9PEZI|nr:hypothetical protein P167DRAFT_304561 [Morchella conica CCBAS932]